MSQLCLRSQLSQLHGADRQTALTHVAEDAALLPACNRRMSNQSTMKVLSTINRYPKPLSVLQSTPHPVSAPAACSTNMTQHRSA